MDWKPMTEEEREQLLAEFAGRSGGPQAETGINVPKGLGLAGQSEDRRGNALFSSDRGSHIVAALQRLRVEDIHAWKRHGDAVFLEVKRHAVRNPALCFKVMTGKEEGENR